MKALLFREFGEPHEVLELVDLPIPEPGPNQVRVRMIASPVNPSDTLTIQGLYGTRPNLPFSPGYEGVGIVDKAGPGLIGKFLVGRRVSVLQMDGGNWAEYSVVPTMRVIPMPKSLPDAQAASFFVNPATVLVMARHVLKVPKGAYLLQSAAGSTLGRMMIRLGKHDGFKTINVVRRRAAIDELKTLGGDVVISSEDGPIGDQVRAIVGPQGVNYAIDPVGGPTGTGVFDSLGLDGQMLVYGSLDNKPIEIETRRMIAGKRLLQGFYLGHWSQAQPKLRMVLLFREMARLIGEGVLATELGREYPLASFKEAVQEAASTARKGKVLLRIGDPS